MLAVSAPVNMHVKCKCVGKSYTLITSYALNGYVNRVRVLFNKMPHRDAISWDAIITSYAQDGNVEMVRNFDKCLIKMQTQFRGMECS